MVLRNYKNETLHYSGTIITEASVYDIARTYSVQRHVAFEVEALYMSFRGEHGDALERFSEVSAIGSGALYVQIKALVLRRMRQSQRTRG